MIKDKMQRYPERILDLPGQSLRVTRSDKAYSTKEDEMDIELVDDLRDSDFPTQHWVNTYLLNVGCHSPGKPQVTDPPGSITASCSRHF